MRKFLTILALSLVCVLCAIGFVACENSGNTAADTRNPDIVGVYNMYTAYAEENGETPMSYEEWLASIKGKNGIDGIDGINGKDGVSIVKIEKTSTNGLADTYTITYSDGNTFEFTITNGQNGEKGTDGKDGINGQDGKDGVSIKDATIDEDGNLIITLTDDTPINAGKVIAPAEKLDDNNKITFKSFTVEDKKVDGKVSNDTEIFYFNDEIEITGHAGYKVYRDFNCEQEIISKTVNLSVGDNYFYILEYCGEYSNFYTVNVRRKPIYTVTFDSNGGSACVDQQVEEDAFAVDPKPVLNGYGYTWDYDLSTPITEDKTITATWQAVFTVSAIGEQIGVIYEITGLTEYGKSLSEITVYPNIYGQELSTIFNGAFFKENNVTSIKVAEGITWIKRGAFESCKSLTKIELPISITKLEGNLFGGCNSLNKIIYYGTIEQWNSIIKDAEWNSYMPTDCIIQCSDGNVFI